MFQWGAMASRIAMDDPAIDSFVSALSSDRTRRPPGFDEAIWARVMIQSGASRCQFCGAPIAAPDPKSDADQPSPIVVVALVPFEHGGQVTERNLLAGCKKCAAALHHRDWLTNPKAPGKTERAALASRRMEVMERADNHLLPSRETARTKPYLLTLLRKRWAHPRFVLRAALTPDTGLLGFRTSDRPPDEVLVLLRMNGADPVSGAPRIFQVAPANFHALVWRLIEHNGLLQRVDLEGVLADPTPPDDALSRWAEVYGSVGDIHRRRARFPLSRGMPAKEKPMEPRDRLHLAGLRALRSGQPVDWQWIDRHRATDEAHAERVKARRDREWITRHA